MTFESQLKIKENFKGQVRRITFLHAITKTFEKNKHKGKKIFLKS